MFESGFLKNNTTNFTAATYMSQNDYTPPAILRAAYKNRFTLIGGFLRF